MKPVRPVWQSGQTGFAQKSPKDQRGQKPSKQTANATKLRLENFLDREQRACQKSSQTATVTKTGQTGLVKTDGKNASRGKHLFFQPIDLPIHPTDCNQTSGEGGLPLGQPLSQGIHPEMHPKGRNRKSTAENTFFRVHPKTIKSKGFRGVCGGKYHQAKVPKVLIRDPHKQNPKETPSNPLHKNPKKIF